MLDTRPGTSVRWAVGLLLLASIAAFVRGWLHSDMHTKIPWYPDGMQRAALLSVCYWVAFLLLVWSGRRAFALKLGAAAVLGVTAVAGVVPVVTTLVVFLSGCALGYGILSRNGRTTPGVVDFPLCVSIGLGIFAALLAALGPFAVHTGFSYFVLLALPLLWQGRRVVEALSGALLRTQDFRVRDLLLLGAIGNFALLALVMALQPEVGNDALAFHLLIAAHVRDFGHWHYDVQRNVLAVLPLGVTFLYAAGYMFAGEVAARLINVGALFAVLALVFTAVRPFGSRSVALLATLLAASSPVAFLEASSLFVDNGWSLFVVGSLVAFLQFARGGDNGRLLAGGIAFGAALSAKLISAAAVPGIALLMLLALRDRGSRFPWGWFVLALLAGLALALPPYVIAFVKTANPVFPFFNAFFRSPLYPPYNNPVFLPSLHPLLLYRMTFYTDKYLEGLPGAFGFTWLLVAPATLLAACAWARREAAPMAFAAVSFVVVVAANIAYVRYFYPAGFALAIAFGGALSALGPHAGVAHAGLVAVALMSVVANLTFLPAGWAPGRSFQLSPLVDQQARHDFIGQHAYPRHVVPLLNALPEPGAGVGFLGGPPYVAELRRPAYVDNGYFRHFNQRVLAMRTREDLAALIRDFDLGYLVLDSTREHDLRALVDSVAKPLIATPYATVYTVPPRMRYTVDLLKGEGMTVGAGGWARVGNVAQDASSRTVLVNAEETLFQHVPITGGARYRYAVEARCHDKAGAVRLQVVWQHAGGRETVSSRVAGCMPDWTEEEMMLVAPADAVAAVVFAAGHAKERVEIRRVSLRGR